MLHSFSRTELLIGEEGLKKLARSHVAVFGVGGVGSYAAEALARAGVGKLTLVDYDEICLTNINRQLHALRSTVGEPKVEVMARRIRDINPACEVTAIRRFYAVEAGEELLHPGLDYVIDAIDTVKGKLALISKCKELGIPIIASMGAGNKMDPTAFRVADIHKTSMDPLAKVIRKELRKQGVKKLKVVYSTEKPMTPQRSVADCASHCICPGGDANCTKKRQIPGSISFVPSVAGLILAGEVVRDLLGLERKS